ncbi:MAG: hypothetical protein ACRBBO_13255 [Cognatishimia sp.]
MVSKILFAVMAICPTMLAAQGHGKAKLTANDFTELVNEAAEISGSRLVGLARFGQLPKNSISVSAHIPKEWSGASACLSVLSVDGFYQSQGTYNVSDDWEGGSIVLDYPTKNPKRIREIRSGGIAPLLTRGLCGEGNKDSSLVYWGEQSREQVALLLNTSRSEETFVYFPNNPDIADLSCDVVNFDNRTAFDTVCVLPKSVVSIAPLVAGTVSFKRGEMGREVEFKLHLSKE